MRSFKDTGIFPFNEEIILQNSKKLQGLSPIVDDPEIKLLFEKIIDIISSSMKEKKIIKSSIVSKKMKLKKNLLYSPEMIIKNYENQKTEIKKRKRKKKKEKINKKEKELIYCEHQYCPRNYDENSKWKFCENCNIYFCSFHSRDFESHIINCQRRKD